MPVLSIHTLGDMFVPFAIQQSYAKRAAATDSGTMLVQHAQRGAAHCDITVAEQVDSFKALAKWGQGGPKPAGDNVLTAAVVATSSYGCAFTNNAVGQGDGCAYGLSQTKDINSGAVHPGIFWSKAVFAL